MTTCQFISQFRPPTPVFTEKECPDQAGKVFMITGGYAGVGLELSKILYSKNATIYVAGRSESKAEQAFTAIRSLHSSSNGELHFIYFDLNDLTTIKPAVEKFLALENRLDVLWNNAGVMVPPEGSKTEQGYEMQLGANSLGHFLLVRLLYPVLDRTAASAAPDSVRICWAASLVAELRTPEGVINFDDINLEKNSNQQIRYGQSKAANVLLGAEWAERHHTDKVLSLAFNPGNLKTELQRHTTTVQKAISSLLLHPAVYGAYTELFTGLSPDITKNTNGSYIIPWGRIAKLDSKLQKAVNSKEKGGSGAASRYYDWCEAESEPYI